MPIHLYLAPAGAGKTAYAVAEARRQAQDLQATPHVLVASALQAQSFRRRLARAGGAIGVRVLTFEELYRICLATSDAIYVEVRDAVQRRILRSVVRTLPLAHYAPIAGQPGFVEVLKGLIDELKAARVHPDRFARAVAEHGGPARLRELADIYAALQARLQAEGWADPAGLGWLTVEALEDGANPVATDWPVLLVDGFDDFTPVQLAVLARLAKRVRRTVITLTGSVDDRQRSLVHRRFDRTRQELVETLGVEPAPLPGAVSTRAPALTHLEQGLFDSGASRLPSQGAVELVEAANRAEEVRAALRWLKRQLVERGLSPGQLALLARDPTPYRPLVQQIAAEFGLAEPGSALVHIYAGQPLGENPAVAALIDLLRLMLPLGAAGTTQADENRATSGPRGAEPALPPRLVLDAWRSPHFDWSLPTRPDGGAPEDVGAPIGIEPGDADALGIVARRGRVIGGLRQWEAAFEALGRVEEDGAAADLRGAEEGEATPGGLTPQRVQGLRAKFERFVRRLRPPTGHHTARAWVRWLETIIGPDPERASGRFPQPETPTGLDLVARVRAADHDGQELLSLAERDLAALCCLKRILRSLVWAEEALDDPPLTFPGFLDELTAALEAASYRLPRHPDRDEILFADLVAARGVPYQAVAVLGLAEGFFPAPRSEDPLLWDTDREELQLPLEPSTQSAEAEYFYETVAAPSRRILLTRPRLTDDGAPWRASPFWEELQRLVDVEVTTLAALPGPPPRLAASWPELLSQPTGGWACPEPALSLSRAGPRDLSKEPARDLPASPADAVWAWLRQTRPRAVEALDAAVQILTWRDGRADSPFDGDLSGLRDHFTEQFHPGYMWSASRLEAYRTCPFFFFVSKVLALEPREEPAEGVDARQQGNIYHEILERVYQAVDDPTDLDQLLAALPAVADAVLDVAPEREGFRRTAWWAQTRREMVDNLRRSLEALSQEEQRAGFVPILYEAAFGMGGEPPLVVRDPAADDAFQLCGLIDRVDRDAQGRLRIIDYKRGGRSRYSNGSLRRGEKIQLPLYALAARDALCLGQPVSGFYWHVRDAEPSPLKLEDFGPEEAIRTALAHAWDAIRSAREGRFAPDTAGKDCPPFCPAAGFCWHYRPGYRG